MTKEMLNCFVILVTKRAFRSFRYNKKEEYWKLKPYIGSSVYRDQNINILPIKYAVVKMFFKVNL